MAHRADLKTIIKRAVEILIFGAIYVVCFSYVEAREVKIFNIHCWVDDIIPFCEYFIIPYYVWFAYVAVTLAYVAVTDGKDDNYHAFSRSLAVGCTIFILISFLFPNGQNMRPKILGDNVFEKLVLTIYGADTSTNIFPSIHVYNSIVCHIAWVKTPLSKEYPVIKLFSAIVALSITLSTVFLKQHSVIDVIGALVLNVICYIIFYRVLSEKKI